MLLSQALALPFTQAQVDFVIPDIEQDRRLCIDPFLLYKSKDPALRVLHDHLVEVFNTAFRYFRASNRSEMDRLIDFPEVDNVALGYSVGRTKGSGMGAYLNRLVGDILVNSPDLLERGLRHIEELQLVSLGIGPDRISDMAANLLKQQLIQYTRDQCALWDIPVVRGVPLEHIFDLESFRWYDDYVDLPINPLTGMPLLLVPRRMVRILPWINFEDYERNEFRLFLRPTRSRPLDRLPGTRTSAGKAKSTKTTTVEVTRREIRLLDEYVKRKEAESAQAEPTLEPNMLNAAAPKSEEFTAMLRAINPGQAGASAYQHTMLGILNHLFEPELTDGRLEAATIHGTERRDIIFTNEAERSFWDYIRHEYSNLLVMFETKNVGAVDNNHVNQVATYLGDRIGRFGVVLARNPPAKEQILKTYSVFNNESPRKVILILHDGDIEAMLQLKEQGAYPTRYMQNKYRDFKEALQ